MYSSVEHAHCESSLSPLSKNFDITRDDTTERSAKQSRSMQQKQYRDKEIDIFAELREVIREATGDQETPRTRHDTLSKGVYTK